MKIDKKVPMPNTRISYPFKDMVVGDSLKFTDAHACIICLSAGRSYGKKHNMKFSMRTINKTEFRIWRTA